MSDSEIRNRLHQFIENTSDIRMLENIYNELAPDGDGDWWDSLNENQKQRLSESEEQYKAGKIVSNEDVLKKIEQWIKK